LKIYAGTILWFFLGGTGVFLYFEILRIGEKNPQNLAKLVKFTPGKKNLKFFGLNIFIFISEEQFWLCQVSSMMRINCGNTGYTLCNKPW
jgi:hypothetical protein